MEQAEDERQEERAEQEVERKQAVTLDEDGYAKEVVEVMHNVRQFTPAGTISVGGSEQPIWRLSEAP